MAKNVLSNPGRALDVTAKIATAAVSKNSKQAFVSIARIDNFLQYWKRSLLRQFCMISHIRIQYFYHTHIYVIIFSIHTCIRVIFTIKMEQKCDKLYPSAPLLEKIDLEKQLEKKINDVNSFNNHINSIKEMITYFKDRNNKSKKKYKNYKTLNTILESVDSIVIIGTTSTSITLSITGIGWIILPISAGIACNLSLGNEVLRKLFINKYNKYKKQYERDQQAVKYFDKFYKKSLQDSIIDKTEYESLCNIFTKYVDENENESFYKYEHKNKINFF